MLVKRNHKQSGGKSVVLVVKRISTQQRENRKKNQTKKGPVTQEALFDPNEGSRTGKFAEGSRR